MNKRTDDRKVAIMVSKAGVKTPSPKDLKMITEEINCFIDSFGGFLETESWAIEKQMCLAGVLSRGLNGEYNPVLTRMVITCVICDLSYRKTLSESLMQRLDKVLLFSDAANIRTLIKPVEGIFCIKSYPPTFSLEKASLCQERYDFITGATFNKGEIINLAAIVIDIRNSNAGNSSPTEAFILMGDILIAYKHTFCSSSLSCEVIDSLVYECLLSCNTEVTYNILRSICSIYLVENKSGVTAIMSNIIERLPAFQKPKADDEKIDSFGYFGAIGWGGRKESFGPDLNDLILKQKRESIRKLVFLALNVEIKKCILNGRCINPLIIRNIQGAIALLSRIDKRFIKSIEASFLLAIATGDPEELISDLGHTLSDPDKEVYNYKNIAFRITQ